MAGNVAPQLVPPVPGIPLAGVGGGPALPRDPPLPFEADPDTITGWIDNLDGVRDASSLVTSMVNSLTRLSSVPDEGEAGHTQTPKGKPSTLDRMAQMTPSHGVSRR